MIKCEFVRMGEDQSFSSVMMIHAPRDNETLSFKDGSTYRVMHVRYVIRQSSNVYGMGEKCDVAYMSNSCVVMVEVVK